MKFCNQFAALFLRTTLLCSMQINFLAFPSITKLNTNFRLSWHHMYWYYAIIPLDILMSLPGFLKDYTNRTSQRIALPEKLSQLSELFLENGKRIPCERRFLSLFCREFVRKKYIGKSRTQHRGLLIYSNISSLAVQLPFFPFSGRQSAIAHEHLVWTIVSLPPCRS